jgi:hypothetical protein
VEDATAAVDAIVLALWLDDLREVIPQEAHLLDGKVVVDPSNPVGFDGNGQIFSTLPDEQSAGSIVTLLPSGAHYVVRNTCGGFAGRKREPRTASCRALLRDRRRHCCDNGRAPRGAGFDPLKAGGVSDAGRTEGPGGDLSHSDSPAKSSTSSARAPPSQVVEADVGVAGPCPRAARLAVVPDDRVPAQPASRLHDAPTRHITRSSHLLVACESRQLDP